MPPPPRWALDLSTCVDIRAPARHARFSGRVPTGTWEGLKRAIGQIDPKSLTALERLEALRDQSHQKITQQGFEIVICSSRNMRTYEGQIGKINAHTLPVILDWLARHEIPSDEIHVGKPWCGTEGFYVDDKAIRPSEFLALSHDAPRLLSAVSATVDAAAWKRRPGTIPRT